MYIYRGDITRDRGSKQKLLRDASSAVTGLAFKSSAAAVLLFVASDNAVFVYNVTQKDKEQKVTTLLLQTSNLIYCFVCLSSST